MPGLKHLLDEIHRRSLWQVLGVYLAGGWAVFTVILDLSEALLLPQWVPQYALVLLLIGLPIVLATSYVQQGLSGKVVAPTTGVRRLFTWRNAATGGVLAFALLGVVTTVRVLLPAPPLDVVPAGGDAQLAIFPATVLGDADPSLHESVVDLLRGKLAVLEGLRIVDTGTMLEAAGMASPADRLDFARAAAIGSERGWALFMLPVVTGTGGDIHVQVALHETQNPARELMLETVQGDAGDVFELVSNLAVDIVLAQFGRASARLVQAAYHMTESDDALEAFLRGESMMRRSRHDVALEAFQAAVDADREFALAHLRAAVVVSLMETDGSFAHLAGSAPNSLPRAQSLADRLDERDRTFLEAFAAFRAGDGDRAEAGFRAMLATRPSDVEARFFLAQTLLRLNPVRGRHPIEALPVFEEVLEADPDFTCPI